MYRSSALLLCVASLSCKPAPTAQRAAPIEVDYQAAGSIDPVAGDADERPFYPGDYDPAIATPKSILGYLVGAHPAPPDRVVDCFRTWAEQSPKAQIETYATSYEGRELVRVIVTSEANMARLDEIKTNIARLADPRGLSAADEAALIAKTPAVAWMGYSIHGNEMSGTDASLAFGYHLLAGTGDDVARVLDETVVIIDPVLNPDGRMRAITTITESMSLRPSENYASMHRWKWPGGRGNHYLFDLNRDWLTGAHPETRGRWKVIGDWNPQLIVDAHEMGATDTYLFSPKNAPYNPNLPDYHHKWYEAFARDLGRAFDARGWAYYTREWADGWFPGYTTTWGNLLGALTFLYEQSSTTGLPLRRPSGKRVTYRESVRGHAVSSWINLQTLAANREAMLRDYAADKRKASDPSVHGRAFAIVPGQHPDRERALLEILLRSGVEVYRLDAAASASKGVSRFGDQVGAVKLPAGALVVPEAQPRRALVRAMFELDPRFSSDDLLEERRELERNGQSKIYDVTAWNLGQAFDLDGYWVDDPRRARRSQITEMPASTAGAADSKQPAYGWVVDGRSDASVTFAARALELGLHVHVSDEPFTRAGRDFVRGSVLVRVAENPKNSAELVDQAAKFAGAEAVPVATGRAVGDGPDLGGHHFKELRQPKIAIVGSLPIAASKFGHLWFHLDQRLKVPVTMLDLHSVSSEDLRRYNVIVLTDAWRPLDAQLVAIAPVLSAWIKNGGTLVAIGAAADALAEAKLGLSAVRRRRDSLDMLALYEAAAKRSVDARTVEVDEKAVWDYRAPKKDDEAAGEAAAEKAKKAAETPPAPGGAAPEAKPPTPAELADAWARRFSPQGAHLSGLVDEESWLTAGAGGRMSVLFNGATAYLATSPVRVAVRLDGAEKLRLSGLLWPEARDRLAHTAYATIERAGAGQVILFASDPVFRAATPGTARLLSNAVVYGPGLGTSQPDTW